MTPIDCTELDHLRELAAAATVGPEWTGDAVYAFSAFANPERVTRLVGLVEELTAALTGLTSITPKEHGPEWSAARVLLDRLGAA